MSKRANNTNLVSKLTKPPKNTGPGKLLPTFTVTAKAKVLPTHTVTAVSKPKITIPKDLTRITRDREGKRALFSNGTGRIADNMHKDTPEKEIKRPEKTVASVLKDWEMFKLPNNDEIT